jgi:hypothetical protein
MSNTSSGTEQRQQRRSSTDRADMRAGRGQHDADDTPSSTEAASKHTHTRRAQEGEHVSHCITARYLATMRPTPTATARRGFEAEQNHMPSRKNQGRPAQRHIAARIAALGSRIHPARHPCVPCSPQSAAMLLLAAGVEANRRQTARTARGGAIEASMASASVRVLCVV